MPPPPPGPMGRGLCFPFVSSLIFHSRFCVVYHFQVLCGWSCCEWVHSWSTIKGTSIQYWLGCRVGGGAAVYSDQGIKSGPHFEPSQLEGGEGRGKPEHHAMVYDDHGHHVQGTAGYAGAMHERPLPSIANLGCFYILRSFCLELYWALNPVSHRLNSFVFNIRPPLSTSLSVTFQYCLKACYVGFQ